jgi:hypothetical protein
VRIRYRWIVGRILFAALIGVGLLLAGSSTIGCTPPIYQHEVGIARPVEGRLLVVLPRTCVVEKSVPARHFSWQIPAPGSPKTTKIRELLDSMVADVPPRLDMRPIDECENPPDLDESGKLAELRASDAVLAMMRQEGAKHVVVVSLHTVMACTRGYGPQVNGAAPPPWVARDVCVEDEITLSAFMFGEDGGALWGVSRDIGRNDAAEFSVDRVLERVPALYPARRTHHTPITVARN